MMQPAHVRNVLLLAAVCCQCAVTPAFGTLALTKFDSLDAYFERGEAGVAEINLALLHEVIDDVAGSQTITPDHARRAVAEMIQKARQAWMADQGRTTWPAL